MAMQGQHHSALRRLGAAESDLTCNAFPSKKRRRDEMYRSVSTSTSGRIPSFPELISQFDHHGLEIDTLARLQFERMRFELEAARKRQCRDLLSVLWKRVVKRLNDKDAEIERAGRRNAELEQKVSVLAAQSQIWFSAAKNNEALVSNLMSTVEQALENASSIAPPDDCDAGSCCYDGVDIDAAARRGWEELRRRTACKVCGEKEVCALILPCRHLCLCKDCEPLFDTCPVCHSTKSGSLQIFLS